MLTKSQIETSVYSPVEKELERVAIALLSIAEDSDARELRDEDAIQDMLEHILAAPGKRVRPAITLLTSKLWGGDPTDNVIIMAAAVELLHVATLVHDDMVDSADLRRGRATASNLWGGRIAVLLGDYLFAASATFVCDTGNVRVVRRFAETIMELSRGELTELLLASSESHPRESYLRRIYNKTASLFTTAAETGAMLSGANDSDVEHMHRFGYNLGMAYQVMDDVLDFTSDSEELGKPACNDLRQGILTLPSIMLLERMPDDNPVSELLSRAQDDREVPLAKAVKLIRETGILDECIVVADAYVADAAAELDGFAPSEARASLTALANFASNRLH